MSCVAVNFAVNSAGKNWRQADIVARRQGSERRARIGGKFELFEHLGDYVPPIEETDDLEPPS